MRSETARTRRAAALLLLLALPALAEDARGERHPVAPPAGEAEKRGDVEVRHGTGLPPAAGPSSSFGPAEFTPPTAPEPEQAQVEQGPLYAALLLAVEGDTARVRTAEGERALKPGDTVGRDVVKSVRDRQIVLRRAAQPGHPGGDALVVVDFDAAGKARVRVIWSLNPGPPVPPEVQ